MTNERLEAIFPNLAGAGYQVTSERTRRYNCIAWAVGDDSRWWEPSGDNEHYWPPELPRGPEGYTFSNILAVFQAHDYALCADGELERGFEKLAIYADASRSLTHVARQLSTGQWTSKLGPLEDIEHNSLTALEGSGKAYGTAIRFMKKPLQE